MKKDIDFKPVKEVFVTIVQGDAGDMWKVYLVNRSAEVLENILVTSKGYGNKKEEKQKTSILRHSIPTLEPAGFALLESIDPGVFHLSNEYWVSFYIGGQIYDKKYIFVPDTINEKNLVYIEELDQKGVLHS